MTPTLLPSSTSRSVSIGPAPEPVPPPLAKMTKSISALTFESISAAMLSKSSMTSRFAFLRSLLHPSPCGMWYLNFASSSVSRSSREVFT